MSDIQPQSAVVSQIKKNNKKIGSLISVKAARSGFVFSFPSVWIYHHYDDRESHFQLGRLPPGGGGGVISGS